MKARAITRIGTGFSASTAFTHPLFVIALVVLVLNDHVLKGAGILPPVVTGKLSDVAGLIVAPAVLAWILRVRRLEGWLVAHALVAVSFIAIELVPALAALIERAAPFPVRIWPDPSDLLALPALALSFARLGDRGFDRVRDRSRAAPLVGVIALVACTATSQSSPPPRYPFRTGGRIHTDVYLRHTGAEPLTVEILRLRDGVELDCDVITDPPEGMPRASDFGDERRWTLARGDAVPLWDRDEDTPDRECYAVRMASGGRTWLLAWRHGAPPLRDDVPIRLMPNEPAEPDAVLVRAQDELPRVPEGVTVRRL